ncbi:hypothetical protein [Novilysobacter selenitireducens]|uniref:Guanylate cyclase domain-containing protein n=1 Tax=Novilysobacter selenitireducens TaxID=2872639 RepID=A0ABS7T2H6_9GAMM|nr:hypothetical protein [Lysobacter selenitireducens]MBZ4038069.1 hypothetical protein [Lysobacter selenitireducens]
MEYEKRIVVFMDILGFRDHIKHSVTDSAHIKRIARAIETIHEHTRIDEEWAHHQVTQFSDCVVVSYLTKQSSAVFDILLTVSLLQKELASQGFLVRGGITAGDLIHDGHMAFGPALVEAHRMESELASVPRILVDPKLTHIAGRHPAPHHDYATEAKYVRDFVKTDGDGLDYLDYLSWDAVADGAGVGAEGYIPYLGVIARILSQSMVATSDPRTLRKMLWLHREYTQAIQHFYDPPRPAEVLERHALFYEGLESLPTLTEQADDARKCVVAWEAEQKSFEAAMKLDKANALAQP